MPFNRIRGFYIRPIVPSEKKAMPDNESKKSPDELIAEANTLANDALTSQLDLLNVVIEQHERALRAMTIFRDVSYVYRRWNPDSERPGLEEFLLLGVVKWNGSWRLCHGCYCSADPSGDTNWKPLADSSVTDRIRAVPHIGELRQAIMEDKAKLTADVATTFETALHALENDPDGATFARGVRSAIQQGLQRKKKK